MSLVNAVRVLRIGALLAAGLATPASAEPGKVTVGTYVNGVHEVNFKESKFIIDFYIWFRWKPVGELAQYDPLESMELINGRIGKDDKTSIVEKPIGDENYASARVFATIYQNWGLNTFPFDNHRVNVYVEDSKLVSSLLEFVPDLENSGLDHEITVPGWLFSGFNSEANAKTYRTNFGDTSSSPNGLSTYSRLTFGLDMKREGWGQAVKLLMTAIIATLVSFVAFGIRPIDEGTRFGLGVGALFAVAASAFVVASTVPDSSLLTIADKVHIVAMCFIFASLVLSTFCLKWDEAGSKAKWRRADFWSIIVFPPLFLACTGWLISSAFR